MSDAPAWRWVDKRALLLLLLGESLAEHGGGEGIRDEGLLDSALARPRNLVACAQPDFASLAASYCIGLAKSHPFLDGNKRAAFLATGLFLHLNGYRLHASQAEATLAVLEVASSDMSEEEFADWLRSHAKRRS